MYNWGEYIDESVLEDFEEATGIKVNYQMYDSNETMYGKIAPGGTDYDVVIPSDYMIARMIEEDMLEPLNFDNIPNFADIDPELKNPEYDPENLYSVPYMWGLMGVIYNTTMVDEEDMGSWDLLWNEKYADDIVMIDNSRDAIGIALKRLGYSYNTTDAAQITEAVDSLIAQKPILQGYVMDEVFGKMEGGNAAIGTYYYGDYLTMLENNPDLGFYIPEEGTNIYVDAMCILKTAPNKANAEAFINYMCSTEAGLKNCEEIWYSTPLLSVREQLDPEVASDRWPIPTRTSWPCARATPACPRRLWTCTTVSGRASSPPPWTDRRSAGDRIPGPAGRAGGPFFRSFQGGLTMIVIGTKCRLETAVTEELTAAHVGSGALPVFGTPYMCALMENAAMYCLQQFLEEGLGSVGTHLDISHDAPTPVGMKVWAEAEITGVSENGKMVDFAVKAWDEAGPIGAGTHTRAIIKNEKFLARCNAKLEK